MNHSRSRKAFTLVEILVVILILGIMGAMVTTAVSGVTTTAKQSRTKTIISIVDSVLAEHYQGLKYRQFPVEIPDMWQELGPAEMPVVGYEVLAKEAARVRLMMVRDLQRMELPDRYSDFIPHFGDPTRLYAAATFVKIDDGKIVGKRDDKRERESFIVDWYLSFANKPPTTLLPSKVEAYRNRLTPNYTLKNQGAECLFLIMANAYVGGTPALDLLPPGSTGDTDEDGMLEILDGWGKPLQYVRWPLGYADPDGKTLTSQTPDDFDLFHTDYAYEFAQPSEAWAWDPNRKLNNRQRPWSVKPLVFSHGADGATGIRTNPGTGKGDFPTPSGDHPDSNPLVPLDDPEFSHRIWIEPDGPWMWPWYARNCGAEAAKRDPIFNFPDPYLRKLIIDDLSLATRLPGSLVPTAYAETVDDITNYQLQVGR